MRRALVVTLPLALAMLATASSAGEPVPIEVRLRARAPVHVRVSEGTTTPCDASPNRVLFDGWMSADDIFRTKIGTETICVEHTWDDFPRSGWSAPGLAHRPKICRGKRCVSAAEPTIRVTLDATRR
jgi:hypothetical protein